MPKKFLTFANVMTQDFESNKKRIEKLGLTCSLMDDSGKVHYFQDGHEYVEIGGLKWAIKNVGAEKETDSGLYFQWNNTQGYTADQVGRGKKCFDWIDYKYANHMTKYNSTNGKTILDSVDDAARFHMGGGWRMPTEEDFQILLTNTTNKWVKVVNGVKGRLFTSNRDKFKTLFFPACGNCSGGNVYSVGYFGHYWSSSLNSSSIVGSHNLGFCCEHCKVYSNGRWYGFSVRGVCN